MLRVKIILSLTVAIAGLSAAVFFLLPDRLEEDIRTEQSQKLIIAAQNVESAERLDDFGLMAKASAIADMASVQTALKADYEDNYAYNRHIGVHDQLLKWKFIFEDLEKSHAKTRNVELGLNERRPFKPELVFVTDDTGNGVAALGTDVYSWYNVQVNETHPTLLSAKDRPIKDIWRWSWDDSTGGDPYHVGVAPIKKDGSTIGYAVVGTPVSDGRAKEVSKSMGGVDVAYFHKGKVVASTLTPEDQEALAAGLFSGGQKVRTTPPTQVKVRDANYMAAVRVLSANATPGAGGFVVLSNMDTALEQVSRIRRYVPVFGLLTLVVIAGIVFTILYLFLKPLEELDQGIQEVIAGNKDYSFRVSGSDPTHLAMAQSLNLMSAYLQGKKAPDEEDELGGWGDLMVEDVSKTSMMRAVKAADLKSLVQDGPDPITQRDAYLKQLHEQYIGMRRKLGEEVKDVDFDGFVGRIERNSERLKAKHNARGVKFSVVVRDGKVVLKPEPIL